TAGILLPESRVRILPALNHVALAHDESVYACIRAWCTDAPTTEKVIAEEPTPEPPPPRASNPLALELDFAEFEEAASTCTAFAGSSRSSEPPSTTAGRRSSA